MKKFLRINRIYLFLVFVGICQISFSQQKELDSLLIELKQHPQEDTVRLNMLNDITFDYCMLDYNKAILTAEEAIQLALKLNNISKLATAYRYKGLGYANMRKDSAAMDMYNKALQLYEQMQNRNGIANAYHTIGMLYSSGADYYKALEYEQKALDISREMNNKIFVARILNSIGVNYLYLTNYSNALDCYLQTLQISEDIGDKVGKADALTNMGLVYNHMKKYKQALAFHQKSLALFKELDDKAGMANSLGNIGIVYDNLSQPEMAVENYEKGLALQKEIGNNSGIAAAYTNLGVTYLKLSKYESAYKNFKNAAELSRLIDDKNNLAEALHFLGELHLKAPPSVLLSLGENPGNRFSNAISYNEKSLQISRETGDLAQQGEAWHSISEIYKAENKYKNAFDAYLKYITFKDSIFTSDKQQQITRLEMQYDFDKKEAVINATHKSSQALAAAEIKQQKIIKNAVITGAGIFFLVAIFGFVLYSRKKDAIEKKKEAEFNSQVANTELKALRAQMNPHFIYNSLNSINDYIDKHEMGIATTYTTKFSRLMRMILENSEHKEIPLADDLKALELYIQLENMRMQHKFTYEIIVDKNIDQENTLVPPLILQPFVENSIWHGISKKQGEGKIRIHISKEGSMINCVVEDNGIGMRESSINKLNNKTDKKSLGMKITKARIDIINRLKKSNATVTLSDLQEGTKIEVKLPEALAF